MIVRFNFCPDILSSWVLSHLRINIIMVVALMKIVFALTCLTGSLALPAQGKYTTKYDNIDVDQILNNDRLLKSYMDCVLERGRCTREGLELKKNIPEAMRTDCAKCSEKQKKIAGKILAHLLQNRRDYWEEILAKYDPKGNFRKKYEFED